MVRILITLGKTAWSLIQESGRLVDRFRTSINRYAWRARSRLYDYDRITGVVVDGNLFGGPFAAPFRHVRGLGRVDPLAAYGIAKVLARAVFPANSTAALAFRSGSQIRSFLALNDASPGFNRRRDRLIEVTGFSGNLRSLAIAGVGALLPVITLSVSPARLAEDSGRALVYTFRRSGTAINPLFVNYIISGSADPDGDDVVLSASGAIQSVVFRPGAAIARVIVHPVSDGSVAGDETVVAVLAEGPGYVIGTPGPVVAMIVNDHPLTADQNLLFNVSIDDPLGVYSFYYSLIRSSIQAAGRFWDYYIGGFCVDLDVIVRFSDDIARATGRSLASSFVRNDGVYDVYEQGAAAEIRTGIDPNGAEYDIELILNPDYLVRELWFEDGPMLAAAPVPVEKTDAVSVFMHELGHAFAFNGWMDGFSGVMPDRYRSVYDELVDFQDGNFYFSGSQAVKTYGAPVPLSYGSITHLGNLLPAPGSDLVSDLMNGIVFYRGFRYAISALNVAILSDVGIPVVI